MLSFLIVFSLSVFAEEPETVVHVQQLNESVDMSRMPDAVPGMKVEIKKMGEVTGPSYGEVLDFIGEAGLEDATKEWDAFERDRLFRRVQYMSVRQLQAAYPDLPEQGLQSLVHKYGSSDE